MSAVALASPLNDLPGPFEVGNLIGMIVGRSVRARAERVEQVRLDLTDRVAVYVGDDGAVMALVICDLPGASKLGAALSMLPVARARECVARGELPEVLQENHYEVMNICARFFNSPYSPHVRLARVTEVQQGLGGEVERALGSVSEVLDFSLALEEYGGGRLTMVHIGESRGGTEALHAELRSYTRCAISAEVVLASPGGEMVMGMARDISVKGAYVLADLRLPERTACSMLLLASLSDGSLHKIQVAARVVRADASGMALQFTRVSDAAFAGLRTLVLHKAEDPERVLVELAQPPRYSDDP